MYMCIYYYSAVRNIFCCPTLRLDLHCLLQFVKTLVYRTANVFVAFFSPCKTLLGYYVDYNTTLSFHMLNNPSLTNHSVFDGT